MQVAQFLVENERLLVVAASTMIMSISHTALRPVLPVFAKASPNLPCLSACNKSALKLSQPRSLRSRVNEYSLPCSIKMPKLSENCPQYCDIPILEGLLQADETLLLVSVTLTDRSPILDVPVNECTILHRA